jgi:hypothetical protein
MTANLKVDPGERVVEDEEYPIVKVREAENEN